MIGRWKPSKHLRRDDDDYDDDDYDAVAAAAGGEAARLETEGADHPAVHADAAVDGMNYALLRRFDQNGCYWRCCRCRCYC